ELDCSPPVLILTGLSHQSELAQAAGVSALVEKPVDVPALLELMRELLVKSASARLQNSGHHQLPFYHLRAADFPAAGPWANPHVAPYDHWGLNE
ncbi:MAG: hypothetical protein KGJ60_11530, partial [Verrucomicrobiota bacterium]|nr:hypothetical protein [Verrucomicrobiota bacterium]